MTENYLVQYKRALQCKFGDGLMNSDEASGFLDGRFHEILVNEYGKKIANDFTVQSYSTYKWDEVNEPGQKVHYLQTHYTAQMDISKEIRELMGIIEERITELEKDMNNPLIKVVRVVSRLLGRIQKE